MVLDESKSVKENMENMAGALDTLTPAELDELFQNTTGIAPSKIDSLIDSEKATIFGSSFDGVNSTGTRLYGSAEKSWSPSTDLAAETDDFYGTGAYDTFEVLVKPDSNGVAQIVAYEGTSAFDTYKADDSYGADVFVMFPKSYIQRIATDSVGVETKLVSTKNYSGFVPSPMHYRNSILHDYIGITKYGWCDDGNNGICSRTGKPPKINITENQFEALARAKGLRVAGINEISYLQHIGSIKYNSLNWQTAVGRGIADLYASGTATVSETGVSRIIVSTVTSGVTFNTTSGSTTIETSCVKSGGTDTVLGVDGAVSTGTDGKRSILTMDIENLYGNDWKLLGGLCRIGSAIYINPSPDTQYAWPSTAADAATKGWVQYGGTYSASEGYIKTFGYDKNYPGILLPTTVGGDSDKPVGDYYYTNTQTDPKIALFGGCLDNGSAAGAFCVGLDSGVGTAYWLCGALGVFIP